MVAFFIHVMGEAEPRPTVCDSEETARWVAARLGIRPRLYTVVTVVDVDDPATPDARTR